MSTLKWARKKLFRMEKSWVSEKRYCDTNNATTGRYSGNNGFFARKQRWYSLENTKQVPQF